MTYAPDPSFSGTDTLTYQASDGAVNGNTATVTIEVTPSGGGPDPGEEVDDDRDDDPVEDPVGPPISSEPPDTDPGPTLAESFDDLLDEFRVVDDSQETLVATVGLADWDFLGADYTDRDHLIFDGSIREEQPEPERQSADSAIEPEFQVAWDQFDALQQQIQEELDSDANVGEFVAGSATAVTTGLSVGYAIWLLRGSSLLASVVSSLPAWRMFDPLPLLEGHQAATGAGKNRGESVSLSDEDAVNEMFAN